jgi:hypothetical protein
MSDDAPADGFTEEQRYRFDKDGYVVLEDVLSESEVAELNALIDERDLPPPSRETGGDRRFGDYFEWDQAFLDLLDHDRIAPVLAEMLGDGFRLDHYYGIYLDEGAETLGLHGGGEPHDPSQFYYHQNGEMYNGLTVVSWNLTPTGPDAGGFCCVPGSHKSNYALPDSVSEGVGEAETPGDLPDEVIVPDAPAGAVVIFTEALTHGTAPWVADHQRRTLLNKYSPGHASWGRHYEDPGPGGMELTERQERLFEPPYVWKRDPVVDDE